MSPVTSILIRDANGERRYAREDLPLEIGASSNSDVQLPGLHSGEALAFLGIERDTLYVQPARPGVPLFQNERLLDESSWLRDGDVLRIENVRLHCEITDQRVAVRAEEIPGQAASERPKILPPPAPTDSIEPVAFQPRKAVVSRNEPRARAAKIAVGIGFAVLAFAAFFLFTARSVRISVDPEPDRLDIDGFANFRIGERFLMQPGHYSVRAEREGYYPLDVQIEVGNAQNPDFDFVLERMPGRLAIATRPVDGATVRIASEEHGITPLEIELPEGSYAITLSAERYMAFDGMVEIEGGGRRQELSIELLPAWAEIRVHSAPPGALLAVDGVDLGTTPLTAEVVQGTREFALRLEGHKTWRRSLAVEANQPQDLGEIALSVADATLALTTSPSGASITVDGEFRGRSPLKLELTPGEDHEIAVSRLGYARTTRRVSMASGEREESNLRLPARMGEIRITTKPTDAQIFVDGRPQSPKSGTLRLSARPHRVEARSPGFDPAHAKVQPLPGFPLDIELSLDKADTATEPAAAVEPGPGAPELVLVEPGRFRMGASRREQGRRSNETLRDVEFTRAFYITNREVTNREFSVFDPKHASGLIGGKVLNSPDQPVVNVDWDQAAAYANWLSEREGLTPVYETKDGRYVARSPIPTGYRLPTEAEWERVARAAGRSEPTRFPWGPSMPPAAGSGNFADETARDVAAKYLSLYHDGFAVSSPVGSFPANPVGVYDLGGNVAEWTHDVYAIGSLGGDSPVRDPSGASTGRYHVIRGSSWRDASITRLRFSFRDYGDQPRPDLGFRLARYRD